MGEIKWTHLLTRGFESLQAPSMTTTTDTTLLGYRGSAVPTRTLHFSLMPSPRPGAFGCSPTSASGKLDRRPELDRLLDQLRPGDTVVVWRLDRLGRSLKNLIGLVDQMAAKGVGFRSLSEQIDTTTANGRLFFSVMGALAQFEADLIKERTVAGLAAARARGRVGGRPSVMTPDRVDIAGRCWLAGQPCPTWPLRCRCPARRSIGTCGRSGRPRRFTEGLAVSRLCDCAQHQLDTWFFRPRPNRSPGPHSVRPPTRRSGAV